jgi:aryl-alcohol dehydrogenase-like predicted oxidoreductase
LLKPRVVLLRSWRSPGFWLKDIVPIPGTKRVRYLEDNLGADSVGLTPDEQAQIDHLFPPGVAQGERYTEPMMALIDR